MDRTPLDFQRDYGISQPSNVHGYDVWHLPSITRLSWHLTLKQARDALRRYAQADARRAKGA